VIDSITFETSLTPLDSNEIASTLGLMDFLMSESFPNLGRSLLIVFSDSTDRR